MNKIESLMESVEGQGCPTYKRDFISSLGLVLLTALALIIMATTFVGCAYRGAKVVEGTDLAVGISVPATEGTLDLNVLNYLSGFRLAVDRNARLECKYSVAETNSYFGVISTKTHKKVEAKVEPCEVSPTNVCESASKNE